MSYPSSTYEGRPVPGVTLRCTLIGPSTPTRDGLWGRRSGRSGLLPRQNLAPSPIPQADGSDYETRSPSNLMPSARNAERGVDEVRSILRAVGCPPIVLEGTVRRIMAAVRRDAAGMEPLLSEGSLDPTSELGYQDDRRPGREGQTRTRSTRPSPSHGTTR